MYVVVDGFSINSILSPIYLLKLNMNSLSLHEIMQSILSGLSRAITALLIPSKSRRFIRSESRVDAHRSTFDFGCNS